MNHKRRLQQMVQLLADFGVQTRVRVFEADVLFCFDELFCGESAEVTGGGEGVDVGPFLSRGARRLGVPFFGEGGGQGLVGD